MAHSERATKHHARHETLAHHLTDWLLALSPLLEGVVAARKKSRGATEELSRACKATVVQKGRLGARPICETEVSDARQENGAV